MGVVVRRRELEDGAELRLRLLPALDPEVRDPERLADRRLVGLEPLRLLERDGRLRGHALLEVGAALLEEVVRVGHRCLRYGKFSSSTSTGGVSSRVGPISIPAPALPRRSLLKASRELEGRLPGTRLDVRATPAPTARSGAPESLSSEHALDHAVADATARPGPVSRRRSRPRRRLANAAAKRPTSPRVKSLSAPSTRYGGQRRRGEHGVGGAVGCGCRA